MSSDDFPASWADPRYVSTVVGILAVAALYAYSTTTDAGPSADEITFVLLAVSLPTTLAYEVARRWRGD